MSCKRQIKYFCVDSGVCMQDSTNGALWSDFVQTDHYLLGTQLCHYNITKYEEINQGLYYVNIMVQSMQEHFITLFWKKQT